MGRSRVRSGQCSVCSRFLEKRSHHFPTGFLQSTSIAPCRPPTSASQKCCQARTSCTRSELQAPTHFQSATSYFYSSQPLFSKRTSQLDAALTRPSNILCNSRVATSNSSRCARRVSRPRPATARGLGVPTTFAAHVGSREFQWLWLARSLAGSMVKSRAHRFRRAARPLRPIYS